jgi:hypothetical protein
LSENSIEAQKEAKELGNQINFVKVCCWENKYN